MDQVKKKKTKKPKETLIVNVSGIFNYSTKHLKDCKYPVVRYVAKKMQNWIVQTEEDATNWDLWWTDGAVYSDLLGRMQQYQKVNHFPGMYSLARKNHLGRNLMRMNKQFPQSYNYFPKTWLLPAELSDFRQNIGKNRTFILKPEASCQGKGIILVKDAENLTINEQYVAQTYLSKPYLIDGLKFDLRIYVLLAGCDPLRIYIYKEGLARFATETYQKPGKDNMDNICMHLTNYAVNKDNENFIFNETAEKMDIGHKRSMTSVFQLMRDKGEDVDKLWDLIKRMMIKTFCAVQPILAHQYKSCQPNNYSNNMCFEILGMDVILDHKLKPYLLEVNHSPSFTTDTPLDAQIKRNLISQTCTLMNLNMKAKQQIISEGKEALQQRVLTGKSVKISPEEKQKLLQLAQQARDDWENANMGNYEKVYPLQNMDDDYDKYMAYAYTLYQESTGANIKRQVKKQTQNEKTLPITLKQSYQTIKKDPSMISYLPSVSDSDQKQQPQFRQFSVQKQKTTIINKSIVQEQVEFKRQKIMSQGNFITPKLFSLQPMI
ncbi:hypothetical protein pb186bvf_016003 [Paramecium bursaria]